MNFKNKECVNCGKIIPSKIIINGILKKIKNRKRCFECLKFGERPKKEIPKNFSSYQNWPAEWKIKHRIKVKARITKRRQEMLDLAGGKCIKCGYNKCPRALSFHHRDPSSKIMNLDSSTMMTYSYEDVLKEIKKCDLLCMNCHAEIHYEIDKLKASQIEFEWIPGKSLDKKSQKTICECGNIISKTSLNNKCKTCNIKNRSIKSRKTTWPSKEELNKMLWVIPTSQIAIKYQVSDVAVAKWVKNYGLTKPPRGYWQKIKSDHT